MDKNNKLKNYNKQSGQPADKSLVLKGTINNSRACLGLAFFISDCGIDENFAFNESNVIRLYNDVFVNHLNDNKAGLPA